MIGIIAKKNSIIDNWQGSKYVSDGHNVYDYIWYAGMFASNENPQKPK